LEAPWWHSSTQGAER